MSQDSQGTNTTTPRAVRTARTAFTLQSPAGSRSSKNPTSSPPRSSLPPESQPPATSTSQTSGSGSDSQQQTQNTSAAAYAAARQVEEDNICDGYTFYNDHARRMWLAWHLGGRIKLMHEMILIDKEDPETDGKTPIDKHSTIEMGKVNALVVLYTLEDDLIERLILADVFRHYNTATRRENLGVGTKSASSTNPDGAQPIIYGNFVCNSRGTTLTYNQWATVLSCVAGYVQDLDRTVTPPTRPKQSAARGAWIRNIDERVPTGKPNKPHPYLVANAEREENSERKYVRSPHHIDRVEAWVGCMRQRLADWLVDHPGSVDDPIPWTVADIGWTSNQPKRRADHEKHQGSIRIMNLVESIIKVHINKSTVKDSNYGVNFLSLYLVPYHALASMAEHVFSRLCGSYSAEGGFNVTVAGKSVAAATAISASVYMNAANRLGPKYELRAQATTRQLGKDLTFVDLATRVAELESSLERLEDGVQAGLQKHADLEKAYVTAERALDVAVDAYLGENKVRRVAGLREDLEWMRKFRQGLEAVKTLSDDSVVSDDEL